MKLRIAVFAALLVVSTITGCSDKPSPVISLEPTPPLSNGIGWGVVTQAWVRLKSSPSEAAPDRAFVRRLDILEFTARVRTAGAQSSETWYQVLVEGEPVWIKAGVVERFDSREQAEYRVAQEKNDE